MGKLTISMAMFNSYVKLPEGRCLYFICFLVVMVDVHHFSHEKLYKLLAIGRSVSWVQFE